MLCVLFTSLAFSRLTLFLSPSPSFFLFVSQVAARATLSDLRKLSSEQIDAQVKESKTELVKLEMKKASRQEFKPHEFKMYKKKVAQLLTVKREKEIEQGISKRESRRAEKNAALDKYKKQLKEANIVIQRPKSTKLRWQKKAAANMEK